MPRPGASSGQRPIARAAPGIDIAMLFVDRKATLTKDFARSKQLLSANSALWLCWPKRASGWPTDLTEGIVRDAGLAGGLVDVKVCAIDEIWSGLKFVYRLKDRKGVS